MDLRDIKEFIKDSIWYILFTISVLFFMFYVVSIHQVVGPSMEPEYHNQDVIVINKLSYRLIPIKRGDIVIFNKADAVYIKRVIGLPGDKLVYQNNKIYINDKLLTEPYLINDIEGVNNKPLNYQKIPQDYYFVMGDNRDNSQDSRNFGLVSKNEIYGNILFKLWPLKK